MALRRLRRMDDGRGGRPTAGPRHPPRLPRRGRDRRARGTRSPSPATARRSGRGCRPGRRRSSSAGVVATGGELTRRSILGAYTPVGESAPVAGEGLGEIVWHAFDVAVLGLGLPALAFAALARARVHRRDPDPRLRAFVSTALGYAALLVVQVGLFSSVYVGAVAERYLLTVLPLLAIALCTWIARGAPAERRVVVPVGASSCFSPRSSRSTSSSGRGRSSTRSPRRRCRRSAPRPPSASGSSSLPSRPARSPLPATAPRVDRRGRRRRRPRARLGGHCAPDRRRVCARAARHDRLRRAGVAGRRRAAGTRRCS